MVAQTGDVSYLIIGPMSFSSALMLACGTYSAALLIIACARPKTQDAHCAISALRCFVHFLFPAGARPRRRNRPETNEHTRHVRKHAWWPTKGLDSDAGYVGPEACAQCHVPIAKTQRMTAMAQALMPVGRSNIVGSQPRSFELGAFPLLHP